MPGYSTTYSLAKAALRAGTGLAAFVKAAGSGASVDFKAVRISLGGFANCCQSPHALTRTHSNAQLSVCAGSTTQW